MKMTLLGATGPTGKHLLELALAAGHDVTVLVRNPAKLMITNDKLKITQGDATDVAALTKAMEGNEIVISALGSNKNTTLIAKSTQAIIAAANATNLRRVIVMSSFVVKRNRLDIFSKIITGILLKQVIIDKINGEKELRASGLDWTIVYATRLNDTNDLGAHVVSADKKVGILQTISRRGVAAWLLNEAQQANYVGQEVIVSR